MARTRSTIRRIDPWSILKFGFVANLVLLGVELLAGTVVWYVIQRLELIQTVCELAATVGFEECGVDGGALFDTVLVLGLLGVVIQTGILVFLTFLANLIFDLTGGIVVTLEDDRTPAGGGRSGGASFSRGRADNGATSGSSSSEETTRSGGGTTPPVPPVGTDGRGSRTASDTATSSTDHASATTDTTDTSGSSGSGRDDDTLFGGS